MTAPGFPGQQAGTLPEFWQRLCVLLLFPGTDSLFVSLAGVTNGFAKHAENGSDSECGSGLGTGLVLEACR